MRAFRNLSDLTHNIWHMYGCHPHSSYLIWFMLYQIQCIVVRKYLCQRPKMDRVFEEWLHWIGKLASMRFSDSPSSPTVFQCSSHFFVNTWSPGCVSIFPEVEQIFFLIQTERHIYFSSVNLIQDVILRLYRLMKTCSWTFLLSFIPF